MSREKAWAWNLGQTSLEMSALFRYKMARVLGERFLKIAERFEKAAFLQYQRNSRAYDQVWGKQGLPDDFAERANAYYEELLALQE
jgi:hypothetical protein